jgi:glucose/mannose-6-phosphate isomerase
VARTAATRRHTLITIPGGLPPRAALGFSFFPLLLTLERLGYFQAQARPVAETLRLLEEKTALYADPDPAGNPALQLAERLRNRLTVIYSSAERFDAVATRWRGQMAENAKALAFGHVLPEMNHNELVGWKALTDTMRGMSVLFLRDREDHRRIAARMDLTKEIIAAHGPQMADVWSDGTSRLARMFSLISLGDWLSYYLAILHREDPTPVAVIDHLKTELGKVRG